MLHRLNLFFLVLLALFVVGVGGFLFYESTHEDTLIVAGGSRTSEGFRVLEAIAEVAMRHDPRLRIAVVETAGSLDNARLIDEGGADLALMQADGSASVAGRLIANLYPGAYHLIVRRDAKVRAVPDLEGKKVGLPSKGSGENASFWFLARHYGLSETSMTALPMSDRAAEWALVTGAVDAVFRVSPPGDASIRELVQKSSLTLVPIGQARGLGLRHIAIQPGRIPKGSYLGHPPLPSEDLETASVDEWLVASARVPRDVVYRLTRVLFERRRELAERSPLASMITAPTRRAGTHLPLHEGALQYYDREKPSVWSEQADLLRTMLSLLAIFGSMVFAFRNWFQSAQKNRADAYNKDLIALYESVREGRQPVERYREALAAILVRVVDDLDNDRISREGFDEFSFTWQAVSQLLDGDTPTGAPVPATAPGEAPR